MRALNATEVRLWLAAMICFVIFAVLGTYVSSRTPTRLDVEASVLRGEFTPLALFFTALGRWWVLLPICVVASGAAIALRLSPLPVAALLVSQTLSQAVVNVAKNIYGRPRPDDWLVVREQGLSFPSGHAATTVIFYVALALLAWRTPAVPRGIAVVCVALAVVCAFGIPWSRIALGAHYATDVAGGLLFGTGWLCASLALLSRFGAEVRA